MTQLTKLGIYRTSKADYEFLWFKYLGIGYPVRIPRTDQWCMGIPLPTIALPHALTCEEAKSCLIAEVEKREI